MTKSARTDTGGRDNAAIRDVMQRARELTVPDRATLAVGLIGNLATVMAHAEMSDLMDELAEEAGRVQDAPPSRGAGAASDTRDARDDRTARPAQPERGGDDRAMAARPDSRGHGGRQGDTLGDRALGDSERAHEREGGADRERVHEGVGQGGRGEFRGQKLL